MMMRSPEKRNDNRGRRLNAEDSKDAKVLKYYKSFAYFAPFAFISAFLHSSFIIHRSSLKPCSRLALWANLPAILATLVAATLIAGCFVPVKGFRDQNKPRLEHKTPLKRSLERAPQGAPELPEKYKKAGGIYHTVARGETVYRIAKVYDVSQEDIIEANGIQDVTKVKVGQVLFVPGAKHSKKVDMALEDNPVGTKKPSTPPSTRPNTHPNSSPQPPGREPEPSSGETGGECSPGKISLLWPAAGEITSPFGVRNGRQHDGMDISGSIGSPIYAAADGVVIFADRLGGYGLIVILKHEGDLKTIYAHNRRNLVPKGAVVKRGEKIAELGNSGNATGPHLHFEIRCGQDALDPLPFLPKSRTS